MFFAARHVVLKIVESRIRPLPQIHDLFENLDLPSIQRLQLAIVVVNDPHRAGESQLHRAMRNGQRILGILHPAAQHRIDVHLKNRVLRQPFQARIQRLQTFLRNFVRDHVIDADLQVLQPRRIQTGNALLAQQKSIGNHPGDHSMLADVPDHLFQLRMHQRFAAAEYDPFDAESFHCRQLRFELRHRILTMLRSLPDVAHYALAVARTVRHQDRDGQRADNISF